MKALHLHCQYSASSFIRTHVACCIWRFSLIHILAFSTVYAADSSISDASNTIETVPDISLFSGRSCGTCKPIENALKNAGLPYRHYNVDTVENYMILVQMEESIGDSVKILPALVYGKQVVSGKEAILGAVPAISSWYQSQTSNSTHGDQPKVPELLHNVEEVIQGRFDNLDVGTIGLAGLADGLNPCAFATVIFLCGTLATSRQRHRVALLVGLFFTLGVFGTYLAIGLGLCHALTSLGSFGAFRMLFHYALMVMLSVGAIIMFCDAFHASKNSGKPFFRLPASLRLKINVMMARHAHGRQFVVGSFVLGILVSLMEMACTGQVYLPTIVFILDDSERASMATYYFLLYNAAFVLPLLIVLFLTLQGFKVKRLWTFNARYAALSKATLGVVFLIMLAVML